MRYGYFDDDAREYVIERPDTPRSWSNYAGDRTFGAIITNNAGGYAFTRSPAKGRFLRLTFNSIPMDQPGRYLYLRDEDDGDFWSASWQPVGKPLDQYQSTCRMGTAYTRIDSAYRGITTATTYFVPRDQAFEYWMMEVTNTSDQPRNLRLFTYCEFTTEWNIFQDSLNLQYTAHIVRASWEADMVSCSSAGSLPERDDFMAGDQSRWSYLHLGGDVTPDGYDLDRDAFIGPYRTYANPRAVAEGQTGQSVAYGDNACGGITAPLPLQPGETRRVVVLLGVGRAKRAGVAAREQFGTWEAAARELAKLKEHWHARLGAITVQTPEPAINSMVNVWNAYNALMTFTWSRSCSLVYTGDQRDGFGYRDSVQDLVGVLPAIPDEARERTILLLSGQESNGGARPEVDPLHHKPGEMAPVDPAIQRADDCLWFFNAIPAYVAETGDTGFYDEIVPYADQGEATVYEHLRMALVFNLERTGAHGLPCGLYADWNDCIRLGFKGESIFVSMQLRLGLATFLQLAQDRGEADHAAWAEAELARLDKALQEHAWDGDWFVRAIGEDGTVFGRKDNDEGRIFLNPQSWAVLAGAVDQQQGEQIMDAVDEHLATDYGVVICDPPFVNTPVDIMRAVLFAPGAKENGGIFSHTQGWAVMADCLLGKGDRAYRNLMAYLPAAQNDKIETREIEPYVHCQMTHGKASPKHGKSRVPWLSGTVAWTYFAMTQYLLGMQPAVDGFRLDPCLPARWDGFTATRRFRGKTLEITVRNPHGKHKGVTALTVDGERIEGNFVPLAKIGETCRIEAELSG